jgi:hypothetical protein
MSQKKNYVPKELQKQKNISEYEHEASDKGVKLKMANVLIKHSFD